MSQETLTSLIVQREQGFCGSSPISMGDAVEDKKGKESTELSLLQKVNAGGGSPYFLNPSSLQGITTCFPISWLPDTLLLCEETVSGI